MNYDFTKYIKFLTDIDTVSNKIQGYYKNHITCKKGCSSCCIKDRTVIPIEAYFIKEHLNPEIINSAIQNNEHNQCLFLKNELCLMYEFRPLICRTQGLPLMYHSLEGDDATYELSVCELNFTNYKEDSLNSNFIMNMEVANQLLIQLNNKFLVKNNLQDIHNKKRFTFRELIE